MKRLGRNFLFEVFLPNIAFAGTVVVVGLQMQIDVAFIIVVLILSAITSAVLFYFMGKYKHKSSIDQLTNMFNRSHIYSILNQRVEEQKPFYFLLLDLNRFKNVNDTLGHGVGDKLLIATAKRLASCLRQGDILARLGGDEFGIIVNANVDTEALAQRIGMSLQRPFSIDEYVLNLGVSIGIAKYGEHGVDTETIVKNADAAMYHAKREKLGFFTYNKDLDVSGFENLFIINDLRTAIDKNELFNVYQPKYDFVSKTFTGIECLCRWNHAKYGAITPDKFIPLAEQEGLIHDVLFVVMENAFKDLRCLQNNGINLAISINVSAENLTSPEVVSKIITMISSFGINPSTITLEVTETAIAKNLENTIKSLILLSSFGIKLSIDDFGTGYSSYFYLKHLPVHELKIDKTFIDDALENVQDYMIVNSIINLAHSAKCVVVAEGVENSDQADMLVKMNCDQAQGYFFSKPLLVNDLIEFCNNFNN